MIFQETMAKLESLGSEETRRIYSNHGVSGPVFGVRYGDLNQLQKAIQMDHKLAERLWNSGNHDARILATMVADPAKLTANLLNTWLKDCDNHVLSDAIATVAAQAPKAQALAGKWIKSRHEYIAATGWSLVAGLASQQEVAEEDYFLNLLEKIENGIAGAPNRVRHAMNNTLIAIGVRSPNLTARALEVADTIGKVDVDHGKSNCQTPDATTYILKTLDRNSVARKEPN